MGAYLSEPVTEKCSSDETNDYIDVGASSMQGWRISQEDAHNCILNFDENVSFFAVYDGHGGAEVATYCAENLPEFLKNLKAYKEGNYEQALTDAFLGFDETLLQEDVIEILKRLAGERNPDRDSELAEEEEEEDLAELCQEGSLPLDQVLEKYKGAATAKLQNMNRLKGDETVASSSGTSKPLLRFSRGKRNLTELDGPSCSSTAFQNLSKEQAHNVESDEITVSSSNAENEKSSSSSSTLTTKIPEIMEENACTSIPKENGGMTKCISPDSSSTNRKDVSIDSSEKFKNGEISFEGKSPVRNEGVSSTSSFPPGGNIHTVQKQENGGVSNAFSSSSTSSISSISQNSSVSCSITSSMKDFTATKKAAIYQMEDDDSTSEEDDTDFHAEENSSTEDGEEDCEPCDEETEEENEEEETEDEEGLLDDGFCANMIEEPGKDSGCTAVIALLHGRDLYVANAGDSRCVLCRAGEAIEMSLDHKPEDEKEKDRIYNAGGRVTMDGRVNGGLNLSRAIGDHAYKMNKDLSPEEQMISALPDIKKIIITPEDEFMILACDGIWNYMSSEDVVQFIKTRLDEGRESISKICEELFDNCLAPHTIGDGTGCDNMTAVIVRFKQSKIQELPTKITITTSTSTSTTELNKKRTAASLTDNEIDNKDTTNLCKRAKTDEKHDDDRIGDDDDDDDDDDDGGGDDDDDNSSSDSLSRIDECDSISPTVSTSTSSTKPTTVTVTQSEQQQQQQEFSTAITTTTT